MVAERTDSHPRAHGGVTQPAHAFHQGNHSQLLSGEASPQTFTRCPLWAKDTCKRGSQRTYSTNTRTLVPETHHRVRKMHHSVTSACGKNTKSCRICHLIKAESRRAAGDRRHLRWHGRVASGLCRNWARRRPFRWREEHPLD